MSDQSSNISLLSKIRSFCIQAGKLILCIKNIKNVPVLYNEQHSHFREGHQSLFLEQCHNYIFRTVHTTQAIPAP